MTQSFNWLDDVYVDDKGTPVDESGTGTLNNVVTTTATGAPRSVRFVGAAPTVTGFATGKAGRRLSVLAIGGPLILANENAGSIAAHRIVTGTGANVTIAQGGGAELRYDATSERWRLVSGGGSPGGGDDNGRIPITMADVNVDLAAAPYELTRDTIAGAILKLSGTGAGTPDLILPDVTTEAGAYVVFVERWMSSGTVRIKTPSGGFSWTFETGVANGAPYTVLVTMNGVTAYGGAVGSTQAIQYRNSNGYMAGLAIGTALHVLRVNAAGNGFEFAAAASGGLSIAGACTLEQFGAVGDGVTDDSVAYNAARDALVAGTYGVLILGAKTYLVPSPDDPATEADAWPFGIAVIGQGAGKSVIKCTTNNEIMVFRSTNATSRQKSTLVAGFSIYGGASVAGINQWALANGFSGGDGSGSGFVCHDVFVENCAVGLFTGYGPTNGDGAKFTNTRAKGCTYGHYAIWQANFVGCQSTACGTGVLVATGNVSWVGGDIAGCTTNAVYITAGGNDGHGIFSGAQINHNTGPIYIEAVANGHTFAGCHIYDTGLSVPDPNTGLIQFSDCILAPTTYAIDPAARVRFTSCRIANDYFVSYTDNGSPDVEWIDAIHHLGSALPTWVPQFKRRYQHVDTTDATPTYVTLATLATGEVRRVNVVATVSKSDGTVRKSFKLDANVYNNAGTVTLDGGSLTDAAPYGTGAAVVELDLSTTTVRLKITGIAATNLRTRYDAAVV